MADLESLIRDAWTAARQANALTWYDEDGDCRDYGDLIARLITALEAERSDYQAARETARERGEALDRIMSLHYSADDDRNLTPTCPECLGAPGVHPCGCWQDEQMDRVCGGCAPDIYHDREPWPCATVRAIGGQP